MQATMAKNPMVAASRLAAVVVCLFAASCGDEVTSSDGIRGSGEVTLETRTIADFERIVLAGEGDVLFDTGSDGFVEVETDNNLLTHVLTEVSGGTLTISTEPRIDIDPTRSVTYRLGCPRVTSVVLSGAGIVDLATCAAKDRLQLELPGAGTIVAPDLDVSTLSASLPGAGSIVATGQTDRLDVVLAGVGDFDGRDLEAAAASVESLGVGTTTLWATDELELSLIGVGAVRYYGEPEVSSTVTGIGSIEPLGPR